MRRHPRLVAVALASLVITACGGDDDASDAAPDDTAPAVTDAPATTETPAPAATATPTTAAPEPDEPPADDDDAAGELFPDVLAVEALFDDSNGTWRFDVTLSSPYDTPERYADAWRVMGPDETVFGVRELTHDHAGEQPFTRSLSGVEIPDDVTSITVEGRDQVSGYGGDRVTIELVRS